MTCDRIRPRANTRSVLWGGNPGLKSAYGRWQDPRPLPLHAADQQRDIVRVRPIGIRAAEDPGTAGDQGEENWGHVAAGLAPAHLRGRHQGQNHRNDRRHEPADRRPGPQGIVSARKLLDKKLYLAAGVAAAFECKTTLKAAHLTGAVETCAAIKRLCPTRTGSPYKELYSPIVVGVLAHSHSWKHEGSFPEENIERALHAADLVHVSHPRLQLYLVCVADLATWASSHVTFIGPHQVADWSAMAPTYGTAGSATSSYVGHTRGADRQIEQFSAMAARLVSIAEACLAGTLTAFARRLLQDGEHCRHRPRGARLAQLDYTAMRFVRALRQVSCRTANRGTSGTSRFRRVARA